MTTDRIERRKVLLSINNKNYNFREKKRSQVFLKFYLVDLNNNFECDWLTELSDKKLSDKKLSDNNLASGINGKISFKTNHNRG